MVGENGPQKALPLIARNPELAALAERRIAQDPLQPVGFSDRTADEGVTVLHLLRAWEPQFLPRETGGLRLTSARRFREYEEDGGIGDRQEGEMRALHEGKVTLEWNAPDGIDPIFRDLAFDVTLDFKDKPVTLKGVKAGTTRFTQELTVGDYSVPSPYILCFSYPPTNEVEWMQLEGSLPADHVVWTRTTDIEQLRFEIEIGIYRWLKLNGSSKYKIETFWGPVQYEDGSTPSAKEPGELLQRDNLLFRRWLRKRTKYRDQREHRLGYYISSPEILELPDHIDIELTRTGIRLFQCWEPPESWEQSSHPRS